MRRPRRRPKAMARKNDLSTPSFPSPAAVKRILGAQYFLYFGVMGLFLPYFNLYCHHIGFSGFEIGLLSSVRTLAAAFLPMIWGAFADKLGLRRPIYIFCCFASTAVWGLYLLTTEFPPMMVITVCYGLFYAPIISFLESFSMDLLGGEKNSYGRMRAWGSLGFILMVVVTGRMIDLLSTSIVVVMILAGSLIHALQGLGLPKTRHDRPEGDAVGADGWLNRRLFVFLTSAFIMLASHGTYYGFFSIHLDNLGFSAAFTGFAWAVASGMEILVMVNSENMLRRFSHKQILLFSFVAAVARWILMVFAASPAAILVAQALHALTYGAFHVASILYMDSLTPASAKTFGQAVNNAVTYGFGIMAGFLLNGYFFDTLGAPALFLISAGLAGAGGVILALGEGGRYGWPRFSV